MYKVNIKYLYITGFLILLCAGCAHRSTIISMNDKSIPADLNKSSDSIDEQMINQVNGDFDNDGNVEYAYITYRKVEDGHLMGGDIVIGNRDGGKMKTIWRQKNLNPWKLVIADVDGDGKNEVIAGVWKKSPKDPVMAKRVFVYTWNGKRLMPKWLGSRLSRRFIDFTFNDINRDGWDELLALENAPGGRHRVAAYRWRVFGFDWLGCSDDLSAAKELGADNDEVYVVTENSRMKVQYGNNRQVVNKIRGERE